MGLLTAAQLAAIPGNRVRQTWSIVRPTSAGATPSDAVVIGTSETLRTGDTKARVIDAGRRTNSAGNISPKAFGDISAQDYSIIVSNETGYFYRKAGSAWQYGGAYLAQPRECWLKHEVEVWDGDSWEDLPCSPWIGKILDVSYEDAISPVDGSVVGVSATISAVGYLSDLLKQTWDRDEHTDQNTVVSPYEPDGVLLTTMTRGWDKISSNYHIWLQITTGAACTGLFTATKIPGGDTWTDTTTSGTLHQFSVDIGTLLYSIVISLQFTRTSDSHVFTYSSPEIPIIWSNEAESARPF